MTKQSFERKYAKKSGVTVKFLHESGLFAQECSCGEKDCQGWAMQTSILRRPPNMPDTNPKSWREEFKENFVQDWHDGSTEVCAYPDDVIKFIAHIEAEAYTKGYREGGGQFGKDAGILWVNREKELKNTRLSVLQEVEKAIGEDELVRDGIYDQMKRERNMLRAELRAKLEEMKNEK